MSIPSKLFDGGEKYLYFLVATSILYRALLTQFILNILTPHTIYWKSPISIFGMSGYEIYIFLEKLAKLFTNSGDPD